MCEITKELKLPLIDLLTSIADDKLMLGHRASDWTGLGPILEEDIAFSAISQEEIAHATALYEVAGGLIGRSADSMAFGRRPEEYRCATLVEIDDGYDWAKAIARQFLCDHLDALRMERLARSDFSPLAALSSRIAAEESTHVEHSDAWIVRLGQGGPESRGRLQAGFDFLAPHTGMMLETTLGFEKLEAAGVYPRGDGDMFDAWRSAISDVFDKAGISLRLTNPAARRVGGRHGVHSEGFPELLDEMCAVYRLEPNAAW